MNVNVDFSPSTPPSVNLPGSLDPSVANALSLTFSTSSAPLTAVFSFHAFVNITLRQNSAGVYVGTPAFGPVSVTLAASGSIASSIQLKEY